jgi:hypothetical protein
VSGAVRAIELVVSRLEAAGVEATRDAGAFHPTPIGVLVGLPSLVFLQLASSTYQVPVRVVSADPLNTLAAVDRLYGVADDLVGLLGCDSYSIGDWFGGVNADPLPAILLDAVVTVEG